MLTDTRFHANAWGFDNYYNPIPQDFTIHHQHGTTSSMSSEEANSSSPTPSPCQQPSIADFQYPSIPNIQYPSICDFQYPSMGMPLDGSQDDNEFAKFHQQFSNFAKTDDTNRRISDTNCKTNDAIYGQCKENCMAIDLSRTPEPNFNRFQEVINFNNRFQEDIQFNNRNSYPEFGVSHPEYSTFSVNDSDRSLVMRNRQHSNIRQTPYQRLNGKNRRCSVTDDVSSSADVDANPSRSLANGRERARTRNLNAAFAELRTHVPSMPSDKLSKIQTLRLASKYIHFLLQVLREGWDDADVAAWNCSRLLTHERLGKKFSMWRLQGAWSG